MQVLVAVGRNAFAVKERLKQLGFKWYRQEKWWVASRDGDYNQLEAAVFALQLTLSAREIPDDIGTELFTRRSGRAAQAAVEALAATPAPTPTPAASVAPAATPAPQAAVSSLDLARAAAARAASLTGMPACYVADGLSERHPVANGNTVQVARAEFSAEIQLAALKSQARTMRALMVEIELSIEALEQKLKG